MTPNLPEAGARLLQVFGPDLIRVDAFDRAPYERDWRGRTAAPCCAVALPRTVADVQALVRWCRAAGIAMVPQGGNTGLCGGSVPHPHANRPQLVVALSRLQAVRALDLDNDTVTVEAGCTLQSVQALASQHDRLFPLSLASEGSCQIGGNLATNAGGVQVLRYGNMRALALGLEVVLPDGTLFQGLRGLRKDNTGYDLKQLFIGAEGTLGLITAATLRLFPQPSRQTVAWIGLASAAAALRLFHALRRQVGDRISAFELIGRLPLELALKHLPGTRDPLLAPHAWQVLVQIDDLDGDTVSDALMTLPAAGDEAPFDDAVVAQSEAQARDFWNLREHLSEAQRLEGVSLKHDISLPLSRIADFIEGMEAALHEADAAVRVVCFGHLGDGNLHYNLFPGLAARSAVELQERHGALSRLVHDRVRAADGSFSAEHGVGQFKVDELQRYADPVALDLMRAIKQAWDPAGLMNPGKLFPL